MSGVRLALAPRHQTRCQYGFVEGVLGALEGADIGDALMKREFRRLAADIAPLSRLERRERAGPGRRGGDDRRLLSDMRRTQCRSRRD